MNPAFRRILLETAETLAIALAGGVSCVVLGLPAGLVSGSVVAVATAALLGRPMRVPPILARICYVVVGTLLGTVVTPETLRGVVTWPASVALLMVASLGMIAATMTYLRVVHRWDSLSALMGASPGSMAQVIALSSELGGDLRAVAIVQTVRVLLLVVGLPNGLALFGLVVPAVPLPRGPAGFSVLGEMLLLLGVAVTFALIFLRLRFPGGLLFGALAGSAIRAAVVGRRRICDHAGRSGRIPLCQYQRAYAAQPSRRGVRLVRGVDGGGDRICRDRGAAIFISYC
jgi:membrane AbrB-like protein